MNSESLLLHQKGAGLQKSGDLPAARDAYIAALALDPRLELTRANLAGICYQLGEIDHAITNYQLLLEAHPLNIKARFNLAMVYAAIGRYEQAGQAFRGVLQLAPDHALALTNLARILIQQSRHGEAIAALEQLLRINPQDPGIYYQLGRLQLTIGDATTAEKTWLLGMSIQDDYQPILLALANLGNQRSQWHLCQQYAQKVLRAHPDHAQALLLCAESHTRLLEHNQARIILQQLLHYYPEQVEGLFQLGVLQHTSGDLNNAKKLLISALTINEQHAGCHNELGTIFYREGNWSLALHHYREAVSINPENPIIQANIGFTHLALGEREAAAQSFETYLNKPDVSDAITHSVQCALSLL